MFICAQSEFQSGQVNFQHLVHAKTYCHFSNTIIKKELYFSSISKSFICDTVYLQTPSMRAQPLLRQSGMLNVAIASPKLNTSNTSLLNIEDVMMQVRKQVSSGFLLSKGIPNHTTFFLGNLHEYWWHQEFSAEKSKAFSLSSCCCPHQWCTDSDYQLKNQRYFSSKSLYQLSSTE